MSIILTVRGETANTPMRASGDLNVVSVDRKFGVKFNDLFSWRVKELNECLKDSVC